MKILVLNCGSSSIKYKLYNMENNSVLAAGSLERIGLPEGLVKQKQPCKKEFTAPIPTHDVGLEILFKELVDPQTGAIQSLEEINAVGHRIVHGGIFTKSCLLTQDIIEEWKNYFDMAPLHNPAHLLGIQAVAKKLPLMPQVGVFDTAFHQTMPECAYTYAIPTDFQEKYKIRRYGAHGTSHRYVLKRAAELFGFNPEEKKVISCHIGNGASLAAIDKGKCVDTSMGMTPLEGLVMGTRCGDIDASAVLYMMEKENIPPQRMVDILNRESGMLALTGLSSDLAVIGKAIAEGNERCKRASAIYNYRIKKYISAYMGVLGGADYILFTAGVGEHQWDMRQQSCDGLEFMGIKIDPEKNKEAFGKEMVISTPDSKVLVAVIPTDEELLIASDTFDIITNKA